MNTENIEKVQSGEVLEKHFIELTSDAVYFACQSGMEGQDSQIVQRYARASFLSISLALECVANCLNFEFPGKLAQEVDKLPTITKYELYARLSGKNLNRGKHCVQQVQEIISMRNDTVHPKVKTTKLNGLYKDGKGAYAGSAKGDRYPHLKLFKEIGVFDKADSIVVIRAAFEFLNYYFSELIAMKPTKVYELLIAPYDDIPEEHLKINPIGHEWIAHLSDWGISWHFLGGSRI